MKPCRKCGGVFELDAFPKHKKMLDGHLHTCKVCEKAYQRARRESHPEIFRAYEQSRAKIPKRLEQQKQIFLKMIQKRPLRRAAHIAVGNAVRDKRLFKQPCAVCGALKVEGHHPDYHKPLEVIWLCIQHHKDLHRMELAQ